MACQSSRAPTGSRPGQRALASRRLTGSASATPNTRRASAACPWRPVTAASADHSASITARSSSPNVGTAFILPEVELVDLNLVADLEVGEPGDGVVVPELHAPARRGVLTTFVEGDAAV